jgi:hypothetical protein
LRVVLRRTEVASLKKHADTTVPAAVEVRDGGVGVLFELVQHGPQGVVGDVEAEGFLFPL